MPIIIGRPNGTGSGEGASGATPEQLARIEAVETDNSSIKDRLSTLESTSPVDYSPQIQDLQNTSTQQATSIGELTSKDVTQDDRLTAVESKNTTQDTRLNAAETALTLKADLVGGKVPMGQLPDIPVGRKLNVANRAARLALSSYADITIAYESDTGDAYALDANQDPAIDANWSKLGNALGIGVASFNGRTGNISAQANDYNTSQITEVLTKQFVTQAQKDDWSSRETTSGAQTKATAAQTAAVSSAKTYADSTFIPLSQKNTANGVAPLDSSNKVPVANLPNQALTSTPVVSEYADVVASRVGNTWYTNNTSQDMTVYALLSYVNNTVASYIEVQRGTTGTTYRVEGPAAATTYSQPVQAIVPPGHRYRLVINGGRTAVRWFEITGVDGNPYFPAGNRIWRDVTADRVKGLWYSNSSGNEMTLHLTSDNVNNGGYFNIQLRANSSSPTLDFICNSTAQAADAVTTRAFGTLTVPVGWDYAVNNGNLGTRNIVKWYELS